MEPGRIATWIVVLALCLGSASGIAQAQATVPTAADATAQAEPEPPKPPETIAVGEIVTRADALADRIKAIESQLGDAAIKTQIAEDLRAIETKIVAVEQQQAAVLERRHGASELGSLEATWKAIDKELIGEESELSTLANSLGDWLGEIETAEERWKRTRMAAREASAPASVEERMKQLLGSLDALQTKLEASRNSAVDHQGRISKTRSRVTDGVGALDAACSHVDVSAFSRQDPPLWQLEVGPGEFSQEWLRLSESLRQTLSDLISYLKNEQPTLLFQALLALVLAWALWHARTVLRAASDPPKTDPERSRRLRVSPLAHPIAAALLVSLILTPFLHPERVLGFRLLISLTVIPVWWVAITGMLPVSLRVPLLGLAGLAVIEVLRLGMVGADLLSRVLHLLQFSGALFGIIWLQRDRQLREIPTLVHVKFWFRLLGVWLRLSLLAFAGGLFAVVVGFSEMADRLSLLGIWGTFLATIMLAAARILEALFESLIQARRLDFLKMVAANPARVQQTLRRFIRALAFGIWVYFVSNGVQAWQPVVSWVANLMEFQVGPEASALSVGGILAFFLTVWLSWLLARFVSFAMEQEVFTRVDLPAGVPYALTNFTRYALIVLGFLVALSAMGFSFDRLALMVSALGVGIGFGLQNVVNNFVSGVILLFERPLRVGDSIQLDQLAGTITRIGIRASRVRTWDRAEVIVPNGDLLSSQVINWTLSDRKRRIVIPIGVAYGSNLREVVEILQRVARENQDVLSNPAPQAFFVGFGSSSLDFELKAFTDRDWVAVRSDLCLTLSEALVFAGITLPFSQHDLFLRNAREVGEGMSEALRTISRAREKPAED